MQCSTQPKRKILVLASLYGSADISPLCSNLCYSNISLWIKAELICETMDAGIPPRSVTSHLAWDIVARGTMHNNVVGFMRWTCVCVA